MALTKEQFKQILDTVFNNGNPDTEYINSANTPSIKMYLNEMKKNASILERDENISKYIVAILQTEKHSYLDENSEIAYYTCKDIKGAILTTVDELEEYNRGVSSYIPMKQYIRNICAFLGVSMSEDFDTLQPLYYQDMVDIVKKYCTLNNKGLAYWGRYDVSGTATYKSYVPVMCLVDMAIYLNELGIFAINNTLYASGLYNLCSIVSGLFTTIALPVTLRDYLPKVSDYFDVQKKKDFLDNLLIFYNDWYQQTSTETFINLLVTEYENDIDFNKLIIANIIWNTSLSFYVFDLSCSVSGSSGYTYVTNITDDFTVINYKVAYSNNNYNFTKTITNYNKYDVVRITSSNSNNRCNYSNILYNKILKPYYLTINSTGSRRYELLEGFNQLNNNVRYDNLKFCRDLSLPQRLVSNNSYLAFKALNLNITDKDLIIIDGYSNLFIFKNVNSIMSDILKLISGYDYFAQNLYKRYYQNGVWHDETIYYKYNPNSSISSNVMSNHILHFYENIDYEVYTFNTTNHEYILYDSGTTQDYTFPTQINNNTINFSFSNFGEIVEYHPVGELDGLTKMSGATYPSSIVDQSSFITTYSGATYRTISNPYYENDELVITNLHTDTWVACNTTKNIPVSQSDTQNPNVDDLTDDEMKEVTKDIDNSTNEDDSEDEETQDNPDDYSEDENEGGNTIPTINDVFHYGYNAFINQWVLNTANLNEFGRAINNKDFIDLIVGLVADPLDAIISLQVVPISLMPTYDSTARHIYIRGQELQYHIQEATQTTTVYPVGFLLLDNVSEFDLGEIEISKTHNNYLDVDDTSLTLFLPFAGNLELDIRDFYGGKIKIKGFCETYTGQVIYYIISEVDNFERIITTITANCFASIPLKSDGFASLINGFTRG